MRIIATRGPLRWYGRPYRPLLRLRPDKLRFVWLGCEIEIVFREEAMRFVNRFYNFMNRKPHRWSALKRLYWRTYYSLGPKDGWRD